MAATINRSRLRRDHPIAVGTVTLTPVVREDLTVGRAGPGPWAVADKRPVAVIVADAASRRLIRIEEVE